VSALDAHLEAMVRRVVAQELEARGVGTTGTPFYSSRNLPPDIRSRDRFNRLARHVPGATKTGRVWVVPVDAWHAFRSGAAPVCEASGSAVQNVLARYRRTA
jgi:hypothetical protein